MSLFGIINSLKSEQLKVVGDVLGISIDRQYSHLPEDSKVAALKWQIKESLICFYKSSREETVFESFGILELWRDIALEIIIAKKIKKENAELKETLVNELNELQSQASLDDDDRMISITRDILLLLWLESSKKEQERFMSVVRKELKDKKIKFTEDELNKSLQFLLMGSMGSVVPIAVPLVAGIMFQQLTKGFIAWFLIAILGRQTLQMTLLGLVSGPIGWSIAVGTGALGIALSALKYGKDKEKLRFAQAILSIYAYRFQNDLW